MITTIQADNNNQKIIITHTYTNKEEYNKQLEKIKKSLKYRELYNKIQKERQNKFAGTK